MEERNKNGFKQATETDTQELVDSIKMLPLRTELDPSWISNKKHEWLEKLYKIQWQQ